MAFVSKLEIETIDLLDKLIEKYKEQDIEQQKNSVIYDLIKENYEFRIEGKKRNQLLLYKENSYSFVDLLTYKGKKIDYQFVNLS